MAQIEVKKIKLNNGIEVPMIGFGTYRAEDKDSLSRALKCAIRNGYRHIDTAWAYDNEHIIGNTLHEIFEDPSYNVKRQDIFICSKVWNAFHSADLVRENLNDSLRKLKTSYLDL
jgi:diketogulonate reductase-like aldo/keto reductase